MTEEKRQRNAAILASADPAILASADPAIVDALYSVLCARCTGNENALIEAICNLPENIVEEVTKLSRLIFAPIEAAPT